MPPPRPPSTASHRSWPWRWGTGASGSYNLDPGYVETERQLVNAAALGLTGRYQGAPPSVPAAAIVWLADSPDAVENGQTVRALKVALEHRLHPDWR